MKLVVNVKGLGYATINDDWVWVSPDDTLAKTLTALTPSQLDYPATPSRPSRLSDVVECIGKVLPLEIVDAVGVPTYDPNKVY